MRPRDLLFLFLAGLLLSLVVSGFQSSPGYMDAEYYFSGGMQLATGRGFSEPFLWNYLDDPQSIPRASHAYWMPLASLLAAAGMVVTGSSSFWAGRLFFLFLAGLLPAATTWLAWELLQKRSQALFAGWLALLPGFYLPYLATTDTFSLYASLGTTWLMMTGRIARNQSTDRLRWAKVIAMGIIAGLMHLARTDGILWLGMSCLFVLMNPGSENKSRLRDWLLVGIGYLLIMGPWMVRNLVEFGSPLGTAATRMLWLVDYDDLFIYPASQLTPQRWIAQGIGSIVQTRITALGANLQSSLAVQGSIFLAPLMILGICRLREDVRVRYGVLSWALLLGLMSFVFPFAGARGGFFHGGAAVQPLFWAMVPEGLEGFIAWGARRRGWDERQAGIFFRPAILLFTMTLTLYLSATRLGFGSQGAGWDNSHERYVRIEEQLAQLGVQPGDRVLVNNPPGYFVAARREAMAIPDAGLEELKSVAARYQARYVLLEANHPRDFNELYHFPGDRPGLRYLTSYDDTRIFRIEP